MRTAHGPISTSLCRLECGILQTGTSKISECNPENILTPHRFKTGSEDQPASIQRIWGLSGQGVELTAHLHLVPKLELVELQLHSSLHLYGMMLN